MLRIRSSFKIACLLVVVLLSTQAEAQLLNKTAPFEVRLGVNHSKLNQLDNSTWIGANASFLLIYPVRHKKVMFVTGLEFQLVRHEEIEKLPPRQEDFVLVKNKGLVSIPVLIRYPFLKETGFGEGGLSLDFIGVGGQAGLGFKIPVRGDFLTMSLHQQYSIIPHWGNKHFETEVPNDVMISKLKVGILITKKKIKDKKKSSRYRRVTH